MTFAGYKAQLICTATGNRPAVHLIPASAVPAECMNEPYTSENMPACSARVPRLAEIIGRDRALDQDFHGLPTAEEQLP